MGYIHSIVAVMEADRIGRRAREIKREKMKLGKLQQELFELVADFVYNDGETYEECLKGYSSWEAYLEDLKKDIKGMNAAELRHNIKVWKES